MPLSLFKTRLSNLKFGPPYQIRDNLTFSPSSVCESSDLFIGSLPPITMASADFLAYINQIYSKTSPGKSVLLTSGLISIAIVNSLRSFPSSNPSGIYYRMIFYYGRYNGVLAYLHFVASYPSLR